MVNALPVKICESVSRTSMKPTVPQIFVSISIAIMLSRAESLGYLVFNGPFRCFSHFAGVAFGCATEIRLEK
jgi:hypothetical protein